MARSFAAVLALLLAGTATAQDRDLDYSYLEASYANADYDRFRGDGDGFGIAASLELTDNIHVFGGYSGADVASNIDTDGWHAGIGINVPLGDLLDAVVGLSYQSTDLGLPGGGSLNDDGFGLRAGIRALANEWIELNGGLTYVDLDSGKDTQLDAGFLVNIADAFAVGVSGKWGDNLKIWSLNGRLYFE